MMYESKRATKHWFASSFTWGLSTIAVAFLVGCSGSDVWFWNGQWDRQITVPKGIQGRCVDEQMIIDDDQWLLTVQVHSTFACDQPYLELGFEGDIEKANIRKDSDDRDVTFEIADIELVSMVDISGDERSPLSSSGVADMSDKYVAKGQERIVMPVFFDVSKHQMIAPVFRPVLDLAIPDHPNKNVRLRYQRVPVVASAED